MRTGGERAYRRRRTNREETLFLFAQYQAAVLEAHRRVPFSMGHQRCHNLHARPGVNTV